MKKDPSQDKLMYIIGWVGVTLGLAVLLLSKILPSVFWVAMPKCAIHLKTGYYCPGCGGTRAVRFFLEGHWIQSFLYHPFVIYAFFVGGWFMVSQTIERITKGKVKIAMHFREIYLWIALALIAVNFLVKNLALLIWNIPLMD